LSKKDHRRPARRQTSSSNNINRWATSSSSPPEVTRGAREVGTRGSSAASRRARSRATWKAFTTTSIHGDDTSPTQVREIREGRHHHVANGDLKAQAGRLGARRSSCFALLADPQQHDRNARAVQPTRCQTVAREVGIEGKSAARPACRALRRVERLPGTVNQAFFPPAPPRTHHEGECASPRSPPGARVISNPQHLGRCPGEVARSKTHQTR